MSVGIRTNWRRRGIQVFTSSQKEPMYNNRLASPLDTGPFSNLNRENGSRCGAKGQVQA